jgi:hypothetical protein
MRLRTPEQDHDWKKAEYNKTPWTHDTRVKDKEWQRAYRERKRVEKLTETLRSPYLVLSGWEVYDFRKEHDKFISPLKVPDLSRSELKYPDSCRTEDDRRQFYAEKLRDSDTNKKGCGVYLDGFLYDKIDESKWYVIDGNTIINTHIEQKDGSFEAGPPVSVFDCPPSHELDPDNSLHQFGDLIAGRHAHVRKDRGSKGTMHSFGKRVYNGDLGEYARNISDTNENKLARWLCQDSTKNLLDLLKILFPRELRAMQKLERNVGIFPADYMGGMEIEELYLRRTI